ncbi:MAG: hypothetical protein IPI43_12915 [Sandaracinaceae bacterium]|nr:hypothetical protein [Sandaracinaceae bacterium]
MDKHTPGIEAARHAMIDALEAGTGEPPLRAWVDALVRPLAAKLDDEDGGRAFLRVQAELMRQPDATLEHRAKQNRGAERLLRGMTRATTGAVPVPRALLAARMLLVTGLLFHGMSDYLARDAGGPPPRAVFVEALVDAIEALLAASPSASALAAGRRG